MIGDEHWQKTHHAAVALLIGNTRRISLIFGFGLACTAWCGYLQNLDTHIMGQGSELPG